MKDCKNMSQTSVSTATNLDELADFWDNHSLADHLEQTHPVAFEVHAQQRHRITIDPDVYTRMEEQAYVRGLMLETLVNLWLKERLQENVRATC
jgi:hypothetical protein